MSAVSAFHLAFGSSSNVSSILITAYSAFHWQVLRLLSDAILLSIGTTAMMLCDDNEECFARRFKYVSGVFDIDRT